MPSSPRAGRRRAGILLGPSVLGWLWPDLQHWIFPTGKEQRLMIDAISQFGILLLLLLTGMETDLKLVRKVSKAAISISLTGVTVPFACGLLMRRAQAATTNHSVASFGHQP
jgi:Kef-type K+ transport system membrane component KefB